MPRDEIREVRIPDRGFADMALIAEHAGKLASINAVASEKGAAVSLDELAKAAAEKTGIAEDELGKLLRALVGLHSLRRSLKLDGAQLATVLTRSIEKQARDDWRKEHLARWMDGRETIAETLSPDHPLAIRGKATELTYAYQNVLEETRIFTDVRPVFDEEGENVLETVIVHLLTIGYFDGSHSSRIHVAMDAADVSELKRLCERAERKAASLKRSLGGLPWPTSVAGE